MNSAKKIMILALFLTMRATIERSDGCNCAAVSTSSHSTSGCSTVGCSVGDNFACYDGSYASPPPARPTPYGIDRDPPPGSVIGGSRIDTYFGCTCPGYYYNTTNAYYYTYAALPDGTPVIFANGYNYATCTDFGLNARDSYGNLPGDGHQAIDCCNFCCNRTDPYTLPTTTILPTGGGSIIILYKSLYLSGLTMLILTTLKIN